MTYDTEHKLRSFLNSKQAEQEKLCLAILPTMGAYSSVRPRRPEGGPDGARDIEAYFNGTLLTWGAVGFRNNAGSSQQDRKWAENKFISDLDAALQKNPGLPGFVFFTNVDLTPGQIEALEQNAHAHKVTHVEVFDFNRIRDALDRPSGFIARLQYLDVVISKDEQLGLVHNFGQELQKTLNSGFSRMERTLERLEKFLNVRKPLHHIVLLHTLDQQLADISVSPQVIVTDIRGLWPASLNYLRLIVRAQQHTANDDVVASLESWVIIEGQEGKARSPKNHLHFRSTKSRVGVLVVASYDFSFSAGGGSLHLADVTTIQVSIFASPLIASHILKFQLDMNGYTVLGRDRLYEEGGGGSPPSLPEELANQPLRQVLSFAHSISHDELQRSGLSFDKS